MIRPRLSRFLMIGLVAVGSLVSGYVVAQVPFPNINDAEGHLQVALDSLSRAPDRFGGHKAEAQRLIRAALSELEVAKRDFR